MSKSKYTKMIDDWIKKNPCPDVDFSTKESKSSKYNLYDLLNDPDAFVAILKSNSKFDFSVEGDDVFYVYIHSVKEETEEERYSRIKNEEEERLQWVDAFEEYKQHVEDLKKKEREEKKLQDQTKYTPEYVEYLRLKDSLKKKGYSV